MAGPHKKRRKLPLVSPQGEEKLHKLASFLDRLYASFREGRVREPSIREVVDHYDVVFTLCIAPERKVPNVIRTYLYEELLIGRFRTALRRTVIANIESVGRLVHARVGHKGIAKRILMLANHPASELLRWYNIVRPLIRTLRYTFSYLARYDGPTDSVEKDLWLIFAKEVHSRYAGDILALGDERQPESVRKCIGHLGSWGAAQKQ